MKYDERIFQAVELWKEDCGQDYVTADFAQQLFSELKIALEALQIAKFCSDPDIYESTFNLIVKSRTEFERNSR